MLALAGSFAPSLVVSRTAAPKMMAGEGRGTLYSDVASTIGNTPVVKM